MRDEAHKENVEHVDVAVVRKGSCTLEERCTVNSKTKYLDMTILAVATVMVIQKFYSCILAVLPR